MGYTELGKIIRKLMIDREENLTDVANLFNVTTSFVSAVLIGKKTIPDDWLPILYEHFNADDNLKKEIYDAYCKTKKIIKLDISNESDNAKKLAIQFQRKLSNLSDTEMKKLFEILGDEDGLSSK